MKLWVTLDGRDEEVEFHTEGDHLWLDVAGRRLAADFHRLPDGEVYSLLVNGRSFEVRVVQAGGAAEVTHRGATLPVEVRHPLEKFVQSSLRAAGGGGGETLTAPMPGLVVSLNVSEGQEVAAGDPLCVVEAMKMENVLKAERDAKVSKILAKPGDSLNVDAVILEFA